MAAFEEQFHVAHGGGVGFFGSETGDARAQAAMNVELQTRVRMVAREINFAGRHFEMAVNEMDQTVRQIAWEKRAVVSATVFQNAARYVNTRVMLIGELDVGKCFVVAQQNVEARFVLLDEVVFERERFFVVVDLNKIDIARFPDRVPVLASASRSSLK